MTARPAAGTRIAMVVPSLRGGGLERVVADVSVALQQTGMHVAVFGITGLGVHAERLERAGIACHDVREGRWRVRGLPGRLLAALRTFGPAVVHAHSGTWLPAAVATTLLRRPRLVFTDHGRYPPEPRLRALVERWCARRSAAVVAVSDAAGAYMQTFLHLATPPRIIENGIDLAPYQQAGSSRDALRAAWGAAPTDVVLIALGRLEPVKNHALLLDALAHARSRAPRLRLVVVGRGALEEALRAQAERLGIADAVCFLGYRTDVAACLAAADVFANTSTTEGLPISLLEALATGLAVVATAVGGVPGTLGDPPAGLLAPSGDLRAVTEALVTLGTDDAARARYGTLARARADCYSLDRCAARHLALYADILGER